MKNIDDNVASSSEAKGIGDFSKLEDGNGNNIQENEEHKLNKSDSMEKKKETLIDILTAKDADYFVDRRRKTYWAFANFKSMQAGTEGTPLSYSPDRNDFIVVVFSLVLIMLFITAVYCVMAYKVDKLTKFHSSQAGLMLLIACLILLMMINYIFCCSACARKLPCNIVLVTLTVVCYTVICAFFTTKMVPEIVLCALGTTIIIVLICLGLAFTSVDFTKFLIILLVASLALCVAMMMGFLICTIFNIQFTMFRFITMTIGAFIHSVTLIAELQMILGGKAVELGEDEWAFGAYMLYTSVVDMFIRFMIIFSDLMELLDD